MAKLSSTLVGVAGEYFAAAELTRRGYTFSDSEFIEIVPFPNLPKYGWPIHPVVLEIDHKELGHIQLKTEIHPLDGPVPPVIYSRP